MAHTLTFSGDLTVSVDGQSVTSPYTLAKSCTLRFESTNENFGLKVNDEAYYKGTTTIDLADTDIMVNTSVPALTGGSPVIVIVNYTESVTRKSVDLTTLTGWDSLSAGTHAITVKAKADGYKDSEPSAAVNVEKAATSYSVAVNLITYSLKDMGKSVAIYDGDITGTPLWSTEGAIPDIDISQTFDITSGYIIFAAIGKVAGNLTISATNFTGDISVDSQEEQSGDTPAYTKCRVESDGSVKVLIDFNN